MLDFFLLFVATFNFVKRYLKKRITTFKTE